MTADPRHLQAGTEEFDSPFMMPELAQPLPGMARTGRFESEFEQLWAMPETGIAPAFEEEQARPKPVRITDTVGVPWRWICRVETRHGSGTGVLVSNRHVLTAAHLVSGVSGLIRVKPGLNETDEPLGTYSVHSSAKIPSDYREKDDNYDYALLRLDDAVGDKKFKALQGNALCYWGDPKCGEKTVFARRDPAKLNQKRAFIAGYPGNKLMSVDGFLYDAVRKDRFMRITADVTPGFSGSPVWIVENGMFCLVGIAVSIVEGGSPTHVVRVTRELVRQLRQWITEDGEAASMREGELPGESESEGIALGYPETEAPYEFEGLAVETPAEHDEFESGFAGSGPRELDEFLAEFEGEDSPASGRKSGVSSAPGRGIWKYSDDVSRQSFYAFFQVALQGSAGKSKLSARARAELAENIAHVAVNRFKTHAMQVSCAVDAAADSAAKDTLRMVLNLSGPWGESFKSALQATSGGDFRSPSQPVNQAAAIAAEAVLASGQLNESLWRIFSQCAKP
jgi:V8-like Glu-specific endopeptidase